MSVTPEMDLKYKSLTFKKIIHSYDGKRFYVKKRLDISEE
jgi:hypothetical protein